MGDGGDKTIVGSIKQGAKDVLAVVAIFTPAAAVIPTKEVLIAREGMVENFVEIPGTLIDTGNAAARKVGLPHYDGSLAKDTEHVLRESFTKTTGIDPSSSHDKKLMIAGGIAGTVATAALPAATAIDVVRSGEVLETGWVAGKLSNLTGLSEKTTTLASSGYSVTSATVKALDGTTKIVLGTPKAS